MNTPPPEIGINGGLVLEYERARQTALDFGFDGLNSSEHSMISGGLGSWVAHYRISQQKAPTSPHNPWKTVFTAGPQDNSDRCVVDLIASMAMDSIITNGKAKHAQ